MSQNPNDVAELHRVVRLLERSCCDLLMRGAGLSPEMARARLDQELGYYRNLSLELNTLQDIFRRFCASLANRAGMFNVIFGGPNRFDAQQTAYAILLSDFDPNTVVARYGDDPEGLLSGLVSARKLDPDQAKRQLTEPRAMFRTYANGILSGARYLGQYEDGRAFARFVRGWTADPDKAAMLPEHLAAQGITGFGPALAADFLKEVGVKELGKPDMWVIRCLTVAGIVSENVTEVQVQRALWRMWRVIGDDYPPTILDKLMFLVGTGRFEMAIPMHLCGSGFAAFEQEVVAGKVSGRG